jgi:soluble lytic murein transglycosylase-like protein
MDDFNQEPHGWYARNAPQPGNTGPTPNSGAVPASQPDPNYSWFAANAPPWARKPAAVTSWKQDLENDLWGSGGAVLGGDGWGVRPETANFLRNLAGIGTGPFLDMRSTEAPVYQQWRDRNFTPVGSGKFVSPGGGGQAYTQAELRQMHDLLSRQAGKPMVSRLFNGPKSPVADFMVWRNQNFAANRGTFQDEDGTLYSHPELESMFAAKSQAPALAQSPAGAGANQNSANRQQPPLQPQNAASPQTQPTPGAAGPAAGNPQLRVADPVQELADFMKWRNQNFRPTQDGRWEGTDARVRTNEEVRGLYAAQRPAGTSPTAVPVAPTTSQTTRTAAQGSQTPSRDDIVAYIRQQADAYGIPQPLALGLINKESHFDQSVTGGAGEAGLCQILPVHDGESHKDAGGNTFTMDIDRARTDWRYNVRAGLSLLKQAYDFAQSEKPDDAAAVAYARYNGQNNWKYYTVRNSPVHYHVYGQTIVKNGRSIYVDGYLDFYHRWGGK